MTEQAMHKDLSDEYRAMAVHYAGGLANSMAHGGQSLALAREAWINAFDKAAEERDANG